MQGSQNFANLFLGGISLIFIVLGLIAMINPKLLGRFTVNKNGKKENFIIVTGADKIVGFISFFCGMLLLIYLLFNIS